MSDPAGVGMNGEPDDFAARYDRMVGQSPRPKVVRYLALVAAGVLLLLILDLLI